MFKILLMPDAKRLCDAAAKCQGNVMVCLPNGTSIDLKSDQNLQEMLKLVQSRQKRSTGIQVAISNPKDISVLLQYLMESARAA